MNAFEAYSKKAATICTQPPRLIGPIKTRAAARDRYSEIVTEIIDCGDEDQLDCYLRSIAADLAQYRAELPFLWAGDGDDFPGLRGEIEQKRMSFQSDLESETERLFGQF